MSIAPKITALAPWFGSNRTLAPVVGELLTGCNWVGVPFAGGMCELAHITARTIVVSDLHADIINLASVVSDSTGREWLIREASTLPFHSALLRKCQDICKGQSIREEDMPSCDRALSFFVCCWMGRSHKSGTDGELDGGLSVRWNSNGGDSNTRYRSAVASLEAWGEIMRRCTFVVMDAFDFLARCKDVPGHGIYCDPPFPGPGDRYKHKFSEEDHRRLAAQLAEFNRCRVVCRFYDHPLIREIYPAAQWEWREQSGGRTQANKAAPEVLLVRKIAGEQTQLFGSK